MRAHRKNCLKWSETPPFICTCGVVEEELDKLVLALQNLILQWAQDDTHMETWPFLPELEELLE